MSKSNASKQGLKESQPVVSWEEILKAQLGRGSEDAAILGTEHMLYKIYSTPTIISQP